MSNLITERRINSRRAHRIVCVAAGGLALVGGLLAILIDPLFSTVAIAGGVWLLLAPEVKEGCPVSPAK